MERRGHYDVEYQIAEEKLGNLTHSYYAGVVANAAASGEAIEAYDGLIFSFSGILPNRPSWSLHAAKMGSCIILRAGYLVGLSDDEPLLEEFPDEIDWIFGENLNETWVHVFKDEIRKTIEVRHHGVLLCHIRFSVDE